MSDRLAAAQAALNGGRRDEAIGHMIAAVGDDPARPVQVYRTLTVHLYQAGRYDEGAAFGARGLERFPRDFDLLNVRGVNLCVIGGASDAGDAGAPGAPDAGAPPNNASNMKRCIISLFSNIFVFFTANIILKYFMIHIC